MFSTAGVALTISKLRELVAARQTYCQTSPLEYTSAMLEYASTMPANIGLHDRMREMHNTYTWHPTCIWHTIACSAD